MRVIPICGFGILLAAVSLAQAPPGDDSPPSIIVRNEPEYSTEAARARVQSTVVLSIVVGEDGQARDVRVAQGAGFGLDEKAIETIGSWVFKPGVKDGLAVPMPANIEMNFHLQVRGDTDDHSGQFARLNFTLPPGASRPELIVGKLPGNPAAAGDRALRFHVRVDMEGVPENIAVLGSTDNEWEEQVLRVIRGWRFRPASVDGVAVPADGVFELAHSTPPESEPVVMQQPEPERTPRRVPDPIQIVR
jgi:TonB family protein